MFEKLVYLWDTTSSLCDRVLIKLVQRHNMQFPKLNSSENSSMELWEENWAEVN